MALATAIHTPSPSGEPTGLPVEVSAENQLLLRCARQKLDSADRQELTNLLQQQLRWDAVVHSARWHKLSGFAYSHLHDEPYAQKIPSEVLAALKGDYARHTARYLYYRMELTKILRQLCEASIPVIVLKGSALMGWIYKNPGVRPMADIDLLVPEDAARQAYDLIQTMGYRPGEDDEDNPEHWAQHQHLPILIGVEKAVAIEVHRHVVRKDSALAFDIRPFWARARSTEIDGVPAYVLAPEDFLLHLSVNFFRDRRFYSVAALSQLTDIAEFARYHESQSHSIDWDVLVQRAREYGLDGAAACALTLAKQLLDAPIPQAVPDALWQGPAPSRELAAFAEERVLPAHEWAATELVPANVDYGFRSVVMSALRRMFPAPARMTQQYGSAGIGSYFRHAGKRLPVLLRLVTRPRSIGKEIQVDRWMHSLYRKPPTDADKKDD